MKESEESTIVDASGNYVQNDENLILHRAAGILRASMINIDDMNNEYVGSHGIKIEACRNLYLMFSTTLLPGVLVRKIIKTQLAARMLMQTKAA